MERPDNEDNLILWFMNGVKLRYALGKGRTSLIIVSLSWTLGLVTKHDTGVWGVTVPDTTGVDSIVCIKDPSARSLHNKSSWFELSVFGAFLNKHCQHQRTAN